MDGIEASSEGWQTADAGNRIRRADYCDVGAVPAISASRALTTLACSAALPRWPPRALERVCTGNALWVAGPLLALMRESCRLLLRSSAVGTKLIAVEVAKVRHVKVRCTFAGSSLVTATEYEGSRVKGVYFLPRIESESEHRAVANRGWFSVVGAKHDKAVMSTLAVNAAPGGMLEHGRNSGRAQQRIVESLGFLETIRTYRAITQHSHSLSPSLLAIAAPWTTVIALILQLLKSPEPATCGGCISVIGFDRKAGRASIAIPSMHGLQQKMVA